MTTAPSKQAWANNSIPSQFIRGAEGIVSFDQPSGNALFDLAVSRLIWGVAGFYVGKHVSPSPWAGVAGALSSALGGPVGLALPTAYYAR